MPRTVPSPQHRLEKGRYSGPGKGWPPEALPCTLLCPSPTRGSSLESEGQEGQSFDPLFTLSSPLPMPLLPGLVSGLGQGARGPLQLSENS